MRELGKAVGLSVDGWFELEFELNEAIHHIPSVKARGKCLSIKILVREVIVALEEVLEPDGLLTINVKGGCPLCVALKRWWVTLGYSVALSHGLVAHGHLVH